jgi:DNA topoisomerase-1
MSAAESSPAAARAAGLRYVDDRLPGIRRKRAGRGFSYIGADGKRIIDAAELARVRRIGVPPAYDDVWICPLPNGHLQATARDARRRKQYRYHPAWREVRDATKYEHTARFARAVPEIRRRVKADLERPGLPREKVIAAVVRLLDATAIRVGNAEYAKDNESYGVTTMRSRHVRISGSTLRFKFRGKSGVEHSIALDDKRLARVVRRLRDLPGEELFTYRDDDGTIQSIASDDVNEYLRETSGDDFTSKDFRTWRGTAVLALALANLPPAETQSERKAALNAALATSASILGNTVAICRKCYVHPVVIETFLDEGTLRLPRARRRERLDADEARVLAFLERAAKRNERAALATILRRSLKQTRRMRAANAKAA